MVAGLMAGALERLHYLDVATRTQAEVESERLRNALLASLSHDLRTPLTVLHGRAEALRDAAQGQPELERAADLASATAMRASRLCEAHALQTLARLGVAQRSLRPEWWRWKNWSAQRWRFGEAGRYGHRGRLHLRPAVGEGTWTRR